MATATPCRREERRTPSTTAGATIIITVGAREGATDGTTQEGRSRIITTAGKEDIFFQFSCRSAADLAGPSAFHQLVGSKVM
mmetsp:Transcript_5550/g.12009  ORF Transcript_5550/g.12009 Transcript_5550/m.12009 type:complete len:82 (-) Transcript_5550:93-338(-)